ncbi:unnamed protein product [Didymodactylos carnosus]|uniref:Pentapeptide repeat-containing protein n=1 Tax=Didymodactylos carnosus TaxID=1234261 RepID=A0A815BVZ8_9BILA|nr:unnamed protein product [Didymodactylos carnosus]CAF4071892.1 unnamed protein product [Didymodactylos carnosus]
MDNPLFINTNVSESDFSQSSFIGSNFTSSQLTNVDFSSAILRNVDFRNVIIKGVDFTRANLENSIITDQQLQGSLSLHQTILPNGTTYLEKYSPNLVRNGAASQINQCSDDVDTPLDFILGWTIKEGTITTITHAALNNLHPIPDQFDNGEICFFWGGSSEQTIMSQTINVEQYASFIQKGTNKFVISGRLGGYDNLDDSAVITVYFLDINQKIIKQTSIGPVTSVSRLNNTELQFILKRDYCPTETKTIQLDVVITKFGGHRYNYGIVDQIEFYIQMN